MPFIRRLSRRPRFWAYQRARGHVHLWGEISPLQQLRRLRAFCARARSASREYRRLLQDVGSHLLAVVQKIQTDTLPKNLAHYTGSGWKDNSKAFVGGKKIRGDNF